MTGEPRTSRPARRDGAILVLLLAVLVAPTAEAADRVESILARPLAVRGGVVLLPLRLVGDRWPQSASLTLSDRRRIEGQIAWVHAVAAGSPRVWTVQARGLGVRPILPDDELRPGAPGGAVLLARLPADAYGSIRLGDQTLEPEWAELPADAGAAGAPMEAVPGLPDQPDATSPFAYWRWVLVSERYQQRPPAAQRYADRHGEVGVLLAEHDAGLWRLAMSRLARIDVSLAERCRDLLTRVCMDGRQPFAAWVADPEQVSELRSLLLDRNARDGVTRDAVSAWLSNQRALLMWLESEAPGHVGLAMVNRGREPLIVRFSWPGRDDVPIAVELTAGVLTTVDLDRPAPMAGPSIQRTTLAEPDLLRIDVNDRTYRLPLSPQSEPARPPGAMRRMLRAPLTLVEVETGAMQGVASDEATTVHLRRRGGRWELFFDCRRPEAADAVGWIPPGVDLPLGTDAVTVLVGGRGDADAVRLTVPEQGGTTVWGPDDQGLEVHRRSYGDRWFARVVLPDSWVRALPDEITLFGCARTFAVHGGFQAVPGASTPWRATIGRVAVDLSKWDDLPR